MRARAVIGANFGDEGKGLVTDYLCATEGAGCVVRFNGGAQAGHTVVAPDGRRHVFSHFGSGSFVGVPTFLSKHFLVNPILFFKERTDLMNINLLPTVYADPACRVTTFADMIINQRIEKKRGDGKHGSVGVGIFETVHRSQYPRLKITMADLWNRIGSLESKLAEICDKYARFRTGEKVDVPGGIETFIKGCWKLAETIHPAGIAQCHDPVFEGAQGLLMDRDNKEFFPYLTPSKTGMHNVRGLCAQAGITDIDTYYVSRTYLTRHGAGPLPGEDPGLGYPDDTNLDHPWQGRLRFAPLRARDMLVRCIADSDENALLVMTHCDQLDLPDRMLTTLQSFGPTRDDVSKPRTILAKRRSS